jgi:hypothetical protein
MTKAQDRSCQRGVRPLAKVKTKQQSNQQQLAAPALVRDSRPWGQTLSRRVKAAAGEAEEFIN